MVFDVEAARAERLAQRSGEPFRFTLAGREWQMLSPDEAPCEFLGWSAADYARRFGDLVVPQDGAVFPMYELSAGDLNALVAQWIGATPGE